MAIAHSPNALTTFTSPELISWLAGMKGRSVMAVETKVVFLPAGSFLTSYTHESPCLVPSKRTITFTSSSVMPASISFRSSSPKL
ncbi:hypothetical protein D3C86_2051390 [compost metagenome]